MSDNNLVGILAHQLRSLTPYKRTKIKVGSSVWEALQTLPTNEDINHRRVEGILPTFIGTEVIYDPSMPHNSWRMVGEDEYE